MEDRIIETDGNVTISRPKVSRRHGLVLVNGKPAPHCKAAVKTYGNIWVREINLNKGEVKAGHKHEFDHLHFLAKGSVELRVYDQNDREKAIFIGKKTAPAWIKVPKEHFHDIVALEDNTTGYCIQAIRNDSEEVVDTDYANDPDWIQSVAEFEKATDFADETSKDS